LLKKFGKEKGEEEFRVLRMRKTIACFQEVEKVLDVRE